MGIVTVTRISDAAYYEDYASVSHVGGWWIGSAVGRELGIEPTTPVQTTVVGPDGQVEQQGDLTRLLEARHPRTGEALPLGQRQAGRRQGFDLTFSPPKSVSILGLLAGDPAISDAVWEAHRAAVAQAMAWFEAELARSRRGHAGRDGVVAGTIAAVGWDHATSREDDPQIHTHVTLPNLCWAEDGRLSALDTDAFFSGRRGREHIVGVLSQIYSSALRAELTDRIGVAWTAPHGRAGVREIAGVPRAVIREFSRSRRRVETTLADAGLGADASGAARQAAELAGRGAKGERLAAELAGEWAERLDGGGSSPTDLRRRVAKAAKRAKTPTPGRPSTAELLAVLHGPGGGPTWTRHELVGALCRLAPAGTTPTQAERWADEILAGDEVIEASKPLGGGQSPVAAHQSATTSRWVFRRVWDAELTVADLAKSTTRVGVDPAAVDTVVAGAGLGAEQEQMVRAVTGDGFVHVVAAAAGSGKTFALGQAAKVWRADGREVVGISTGWQAAMELTAVGIEARAYAAAEMQDGGVVGMIPASGVVVVDEASMMPTAQLASLILAAERKGAQVVIVGDPRQLGSVEAGGLYALLADQIGAVRLTENRRQVEDWQVEMLDDIRRGRGARAVDQLADRGDIVLTATPEDAVGRLLADWADARQRGAETAILAATVDGKNALNALAHAHLAATGQIGSAGLTLAVSTEHDDIPEREVRPGDTVRFRRRRDVAAGRRLVNGTMGQVVAVDDRHVTVQLAGGQQVDVPAAWAADHMDYGYASTIHSAQGRTVGTARAARRAGGTATPGEVFILAPQGLALEAAYVAASRATDRTRLYASVEVDPAYDSHWLGRDGSPVVPGDADRLAQMRTAWSDAGAAPAAVADRDRHERIVRHIATPRAELETRREQLAATARAARLGDLRRAVRVDRDALGPSADPAAVRRHAALVRLAWAHRRDDSDLVAVRAELDELDAALTAQRRIAVEAEVLCATLHADRSWVGSALGPVPGDRAGQLRYREAAGNLVDAAHWITQARLASGSATVRATAGPDTVQAEVARLAAAVDRRPLETLAGDEAVEAGRRAVLAVDPTLQAAVETRAAERLLRAAAVLAVDPAAAVPEAARLEREAGVAAEAALAVALRAELAGEVADRDATGQEVPAAVRAAVTTGATIPAVRAILAAGEIADELRGEAAGGDGQAGGRGGPEVEVEVEVEEELTL